MNDIVQPYDVEAIRRDFPVLSTTVRGKRLAFLDTAASSQRPLPVIEAVNHYERTSHAKLEALRSENKAKEDRWAQELETLRVTKDAKIRSQEREREQQRADYEARVNDLESKVRSKALTSSYLYRTKPEDPRAQLHYHPA